MDMQKLIRQGCVEAVGTQEYWSTMRDLHGLRSEIMRFAQLLLCLASIGGDVANAKAAAWMGMSLLLLLGWNALTTPEAAAVEASHAYRFWQGRKQAWAVLLVKCHEQPASVGLMDYAAERDQDLQFQRPSMIRFDERLSEACMRRAAGTFVGYDDDDVGETQFRKAAG